MDITKREYLEMYRAQRRRIIRAIDRIEEKYNTRVEYEIPDLPDEIDGDYIKILQAVTPERLRQHMRDLSPWEYTQKEERKRRREEYERKFNSGESPDLSTFSIENIFNEIQYMPKRLQYMVESHINSLSEKYGMEAVYRAYYEVGGTNNLFSRLQRTMSPSDEEVEEFFQDVLSNIVSNADYEEAEEILSSEESLDE